MTFIAQPYEQFVDDLLTALTGGTVREEHLFIGGGTEQAYHLAKPDANPVSMKLFGQRSDNFIVFERGIDYQHKSEDSAVYWLEGARWPDERSYFYLNYDQFDERRILTDRNPGSVTTTLAESFGREFSVVHKQMETIYQSAYVDLATDRSLDHVAALLGLNRKDARFATGEILFKRATPATGDIVIPVGTLVSTDKGQNFETSNKRILRRGQLAMVVPIKAQIEGTSGQVEAGAIQNVNRPLFGIETVVNEKATYFANQRETDDEFRKRIKGTLERAGKSSVNAIKFALIEDLPEISDTNIQITERAETPGIVDVKLGISSADAELVRRVEDSIFNARPAGVRVIHNLPTRTPSESAGRAAAEQGDTAALSSPNTERLEASELAGAPNGILPLNAEISLRLTAANISVTQKETIEDKVRERIIDYIDALPMGNDIIYNKVLARILEPDEILDVRFVLHHPNWGRAIQSNLATIDRKATISAGDIHVQLMYEPVYIDVLVRVEAIGSDDPPSTISPELEGAIEDAVNRQLATEKNSIIRNELQTAIKEMLEETGLQLVENSPVVLNALFEETGKILNNTPEINLASHQVPEIRNLKVEMPEVLDA